VTLALYRRYRPETFAEVIGQEHVTEPLQQAIRNGRVHHAYLFSGPRGCGKTTSARILARSLNCETGPTPTPCGACQSCRDLGRGGGGGLDVVEIDAASHGGVDDARDLRERAFLAPAGSRYKIYVIDEAHMVTTAGFNALLKLVEEPPEHLKFIFATTEPDKVLPTIRSRTHHYPFRLVPPGVLREHLATLCEREKVHVEPAVLPLVVRAGAGSVRDSLSVLDQLIAGADATGLTLARAIALLGYTDAALLDEVVDAFAARDGAAVFTIVDRIIEAGHDPRRFVVDLLDRLRDLIVLAAVPEEAGAALVDVPPDQLDRMRAQASRFEPAELSRAADLVNTGLTELRGATAPRLQLELICARVLLPGGGPVSDHAEARDLHARVGRLERRLAGDTAPEPPAAPSPRPAVARAAAAEAEPARERPVGAAAPPAVPAAPPAPAPQSAAAGAPAAGPDLVTVRRMWPDILNVVKTRRRFTWMLLEQGVSVVGLDAGTLVLAFGDEGKRKNFLSSGSDEVLSGAIREVLRTSWRLDTVLDPGRAGGDRRAPGPAAPPVDPARDDSATAADPPTTDQLSGPELLIRELGASVISEIEHG